MATVTFADLTHTGVAVDANNTPLAVGYVAAYARAQLGPAIEPRIFKYPASLSAFLRDQTPVIACFSHYMWNARLTLAFARAVKQRSPETVIVMGGPNYPIDAPEQHAYLARHPEIDFYIDGEGELAFTELFQALEAVTFDAARFKDGGGTVPGVHYMAGDRFVGGPPAPRILDLSRIPSPYTSGLLDEFFDEKLTPMIQTTRGCPYSCTFCHDGIGYMNATRAFAADRVREEMAYVEARVKTPTLQLADLNWGIFKSDVFTAELIADTRRRTGWPRTVMVSTAKNQKDRVVEFSRLLGDALQVGASVQSTDVVVLERVKRTNISLDAIVKMTKGATDSHTGSFTEIILGLPGDTSQKHVQSVCDMLDAGIQDLRLFQFILLPGTEGASAGSRERYRYQTGFRVLARCFGRYDIAGERVPVAEIQEVCIGNSTMPRDDYTFCRSFDLTIAIFNNGGVLKEFFRLAETLGVKRSAILVDIARVVEDSRGPLRRIYDEFHESEARNFFASRDALEAFLAQPGTLDRYLRGEYGANHIFKARTAALTTLFPLLADIARAAVARALTARGLLDATLALYLDELVAVAIARKSQLLDLSRATALTVHFDFAGLHQHDYLLDPREVPVPEGVVVTIQHTDHQRADLQKYFKQYGDTPEGIGQFMQRNDSHVSTLLYRSIEPAGATAATFR